VLRLGKIAAIGKHEELLQSSEAYRRIFPTEKTEYPEHAGQAEKSGNNNKVDIVPGKSTLPQPL